MVRELFLRTVRGEPVSREIYAPDLVFVPYMATVEGRICRGPDAVAQWFRDMREVFEDVRPKVEEFRDLGEEVLVVGQTTLKGRASGASDTFKWAQLVKFREGRIAFIRIYRTEEEALDAAGLRG